MLKTFVISVATAMIAVAPSSLENSDVVCPEGRTPMEGMCVVVAKDGQNDAVDGGQGGGGARICRKGAIVISCDDGHGVWHDREQCYASVWPDPPPLSDPVWEGHTDGVILACQFKMGGANAMGAGLYPHLFWAPSSPGVSLVALADQAVEEMRLAAPEIGLTGYGNSGSMQVLGLPTWMWAADPGESTTGPITRSASAGGVTVTATARLRETVWNMGDGGVVTCSGENAAGTPYARSYDALPSPTCGYRYTRSSGSEPGRKYTVTVTSNWEIEWSGEGRSGTMTRSFVRSTQLRVGEVQVIVDGSGQGRP